MERHLDLCRVAREGLVDAVVEDLEHEVVKPAMAGRTDVHAGPLADRLEALEDGDVLCPVVRFRHSLPLVRND